MHKIISEVKLRIPIDKNKLLTQIFHLNIHKIISEVKLRIPIDKNILLTKIFHAKRNKYKHSLEAEPLDYI